MAQATPNGQLTLSDYVERTLREGAMWTLMCVALYLLLSLVSYSPEDPGWSYVGETVAVTNIGGRAGAWFADVGLYLFGYFAYLLPLALGFSAWVVFHGPAEEAQPRIWLLALRWVGFVLTLLAGCGYVAMHFSALATNLPNGPGGGLGRLASDFMQERFGAANGILLAAIFLVGFTLFSGISWLGMLQSLGDSLLQGVRRFALIATGMRERLGRRRGGEAVAELPAELALIEAGESAIVHDEPLAPEPRRAFRSALVRPVEERSRPASDAAHAPTPVQGDSEPWDSELVPEPVPPLAREPEPVLAPAREPATPLQAVPEPPAAAAQADPVLTLSDLMKHQRPVPKEAPRLKTLRRPPPPAPPAPAHQPLAGVGERPPLELLDPARKSGKGYSQEQIDELSRLLEVKLKDFGVQVEVEAVYPGPVVTLFELQLAPGTKASKITGLSRDLARALSKVSVRVVEVIPGKSCIGIEVPNDFRETVFLSEILGSEAYLEAKSPLTLALGTNISGQPVVADLARMPHVLIAGTTGSGKSVAINAMVLSLVYKSGPEDVRLIMVDPKMLELSVYQGIPHLLTPVVTDMKEAANALRWCVGEMERRYRLMAALGVRNIAGYNRAVAEAEEAGEPIRDPLLAAEFAGEEGVEVPLLTRLPYIVVIIDELADMMMVVGKKVEELIARLAQKARASGIHLMLATQRPSVDVLTGLIKANIPTRMSFQVSSRIDSRTILDQMGAEQLLGHGDMLYLPPGGNIPSRVHGAFVDDHEVHRVAEFLKAQGAPNYIADVLREPQELLPGIDPEPAGDTEDSDPLFDEAVQIVVESRRASISGVQRRLKIGYNRAARMIEEMERIGIVGPAESNGSREVLAPPPAED